MAPILHHNQSHNQYDKYDNPLFLQIREWFQRRVEELSARNFTKKESRRLVSFIIIQSFIVIGIISLWHHSHPKLPLLVSFVIVILIIQSLIVIGIMSLWHQVLAAVRRGLTGHPLDLRGSRRALEAAQVFINLINLIIITIIAIEAAQVFIFIVAIVIVFEVTS